jgi:hypothetical protein
MYICLPSRLSFYFYRTGDACVIPRVYNAYYSLHIRIEGECFCVHFCYLCVHERRIIKGQRKSWKKKRINHKLSKQDEFHYFFLFFLSLRRRRDRGVIEEDRVHGPFFILACFCFCLHLVYACVFCPSVICM